MGEPDPNFEREKWLKEQDFREREIALKERETAVKEGELELKRKEAKRSLITGPLSLAVIGATIAGLANVWVPYHNGDAQRTLEQSQAEHTRIVSAINGDASAAIDKLRFLVKIPLITEEPTRTNIAKYIDQPRQPLPPPAQPSPSPVPPTTPLAKVALDSPWLEGGHNQSEVCGGLADQVRAQNRGKDVRISGISESNRRDFLGHVTYQYHCQFEVF